MKALTVLLTLLAAFAVAAPGAAADPKAPAGAVVLTVAGNIGFSNRPAFDPARDSFFKFHERTFERAVQFDRAMLESLGTRQATIDFPGWGGPIRFSGPRLADVLEAAGWRGTQITTLALDGFGTKISKA